MMCVIGRPAAKLARQPTCIAMSICSSRSSMLSSSLMSRGVKVTMEKSSSSCTTASFSFRKWGPVCKQEA